MAKVSKKLKISLSKKERDDQENRMVAEVEKRVLSKIDLKPIPILSVAKLNADFPPEDAPIEGYEGVYLIESGVDKGFLYFFDNETKLWEKSIQYENSAVTDELRAKLQVLIDKESVTAEPNTTVVRLPDGSVQGKNNGEPLDDELITAKYLAQVLSDKIDVKVDVNDGGVTQLVANFIFENYNDYVGSIIHFYANSTGPTSLVSYGFLMCSIDGANKSLIEIDRDGIITKWTPETNYRVSAEQERGVNRTEVDKHTYKLNVNQMGLAKGLRVWIDFPYQGNVLRQFVETRFSDSDGTNIYIGIPLPEPNAFASPMAVQYFRKDQEVKVPVTEQNPTGRITKKEGLLEVVRADKKPVSSDIIIKDVRAIF